MSQSVPVGVGPGGEAALAELERSECLRLLREGCIGRLAVVIDARPHILPLNYAADESGIIVFRTTELGTAAQAGLADVAFEVDDIDVRRRQGWSVVVRGHGWDITGAIDHESERLRQLPVQPWAPGARGQWFKITPNAITGRRLAAVGPPRS
jgi:nitroimidazol reductase NimA-like FMN-containing flavoprotein (pyridoxamine 5'-phosphate oxidase superfamily)